MPSAITFALGIAGGFAECRNFGTRQIWVESLPCGQVRAHGEIYMFAVCQELWHTANMNVKTKKGKKIAVCPRSDTRRTPAHLMAHTLSLSLSGLSHSLARSPPRRTPRLTPPPLRLPPPLSPGVQPGSPTPHSLL